MALIVIKNWDNRNWLSSRQYINNLNDFILKQIRLNKFSNILDIGCGRGKIIGNLKTRLNLKKKPIGIDLVNHKDKDKRIHFKKIDALLFFSKNKIKFDLILIKQTIHLLSIKNIKKLISYCKKNLNSNGAILIFTLDPHKNEIPSFVLMKKKLNKSFYRDKMITKILNKFLPNIKLKRFVYKVEISKKKYIEMIRSRFISNLVSMNEKDINNGIQEIKTKYKKKIKFNDNLVCLIYQKKLNDNRGTLLAL